MTETATYNGWTNYETWVVNLWLDNDEYLQDMVRTLANGRLGRATAMDILKEYVEEQREEWKESGASMFDDLLGAALGSVNYYEIIENAKDEEEDSDAA